MKRIKVIFVFSLIFVIASCQFATVDKETAFQNLYPDIDFNKELVLTENPVIKNSRYIGSEVDLLLVNQSLEVISFQISEDVILYTYSNKKQKWIEVNNKFEYNASEVIIFPPGTGQIDNTFVFVWPEIYDLTNPIKLRIVTIGHLKNGENEDLKTGAYYDIELMPFNE